MKFTVLDPNNLTMLKITSNIYFDIKFSCGQPYVNLIANKAYNYIMIEIMDQYDLQIGYVYYPGENNEENFFKVLHELINWMNDHENGVSKFDDLFKEDFFPNYLGCEREVY